MKELYNSTNRFEDWIAKVEYKGMDGLSKENSDLLINFIKDMKVGINISIKSKKGSRSATRLNHLKDKLFKVFTLLESKRIKDVRKTTKEDIHNLFSDMRSGKIKNRFGTAYKSTGDYVKDFKVFWHWHQKVSKKKVEDITEELDRRGEKPKFVYFTKDEFEDMVKKAQFDVKPILTLAFDSGARVTELMNIKVSDFSNDYNEVTIREETSKTFGRKIKLKICPKYIREYVGQMELSKDDFLSQKSNVMINKELKILQKVLPPNKIKEKSLSLYDFRHSSACFWLPIYKSESALKYRFGWKKSDMIHYYTELLGMKDTLTDDDMYTDVTKTELEKEIKELRKFKDLAMKEINNIKEMFNPQDLEDTKIIIKGKKKLN